MLLNALRGMRPLQLTAATEGASMFKMTRVHQLLGIALICIAFTAGAWADEGDPPSRIARMAYTQGTVSFQPAGTQDWVEAPVNRPLTTGDTLWVDRGSRAELQLDGSAIRLSSGAELNIVNLNDDVTQVQITSGTLLLRVRGLEDNETYEVDTPNLAFSVLRPGLYRITVDPSDSTTAVVVRSGQGEVTGNGAAYSMYNGDSDIFSGTDALTADALQPPDQDEFEAWGAERDHRWDRYVSAQYVSSDVVGYEDLDEYGSWSSTPEYGNVWYPAQVEAGWAPYHAGHWSYIAPWGYTWVDDQPWGFAPYHYGRWVFTGRAWGWVPCPPRPTRGPYIRPVYAPALVAWVGAGAAVAWFPLGPREVYVPAYHVSPDYVRNINVSNTTVNRTVIENVYNTTIINNKTVNVTYINRGAPGAVTATSSQAFASAQPVQRNRLALDTRAARGGDVQALAPTVVPTKQAVLGASRESARPPAQVQARAVIARTTPPPPPVSFDRRVAALRGNGGKPLTAAEVRQITPASGVARAPIRVAPVIPPTAIVAAPSRSAPSRAAPSGAATGARETGWRAEATAPPVTSQPMVRSAPAVHPAELPAPQRPASPSVANSALEREHLQQQQVLHSQQEQERLRLQQQQELEHQQAARQQAEQARAQEVERQRQQQAQQQQQQAQLQQQRAQQQQEAQRAQQQEVERQHELQTQQLQQRQLEQQQQLQARQREQLAAPPQPRPQPQNQRPPPKEEPHKP
jgi:hypothetical protein